jgi:nitroreductase
MAALMLLLAAANEGLGAWFFGIDVGEQALLEHFGVADGFRPVGAVALGYAAAADPISAGSSAATRRRRPIQELVHRNGW